MQVLNTKILKSPFNWIIVWLMLLLAAFAGHFLLKAAGMEPASRAQSA